MFDKGFPVSLEEIQGTLNIHSFSQRNILVIKENNEHIIVNSSEFNNYKIEKEDIIISAYKTTAHPKHGCLCIKIRYEDKTLVYATDKKC